jgi:hypothetical protein
MSSFGRNKRPLRSMPISRGTYRNLHLSDTRADESEAEDGRSPLHSDMDRAIPDGQSISEVWVHPLVHILFLLCKAVPEPSLDGMHGVGAWQPNVACAGTCNYCSHSAIAFWERSLLTQHCVLLFEHCIPATARV